VGRGTGRVPGPPGAVVVRGALSQSITRSEATLVAGPPQLGWPRSSRWPSRCSPTPGAQPAPACRLPLKPESRQRPVARLIRTRYCLPVLLPTPPEHKGGTPTQPRRHSAGRRHRLCALICPAPYVVAFSTGLSLDDPRSPLNLLTRPRSPEASDHVSRAIHIRRHLPTPSGPSRTGVGYCVRPARGSAYGDDDGRRSGLRNRTPSRCALRKPTR